MRNSQNKISELQIKELISIDPGCFESYPCQHFVTFININNEKVTKTLSCVTIWQILSKYVLPDTPQNKESFSHISSEIMTLQPDKPQTAKCNLF